MANAFRKSTLIWEVDTVAALTTVAPGFNNPTIREIVFIPNAASDSITFQSGSNENAIVLKAGASDASPVHLTFPEGKRVPGLHCSARTSASDKAYVYLK